MSYHYGMKDAYMANIMDSGDYLEHSVLTGAKRAGAKYIDRFIKNGRYVYVYAKNRTNPSLSKKMAVALAGRDASEGVKNATKKVDATITGAINKSNAVKSQARQALDATRTKLTGAKQWASTKMSSLRSTAASTISRGREFATKLSNKMRTSISNVKSVAAPVIKKGIDYIKGIYTMAKNTINNMIGKRRANQMLYSKPTVPTTSVATKKNKKNPGNLFYTGAPNTVTSAKNPMDLFYNKK